MILRCAVVDFDQTQPRKMKETRGYKVSSSETADAKSRIFFALEKAKGGKSKAVALSLKKSSPVKRKKIVLAKKIPLSSSHESISDEQGSKESPVKPVQAKKAAKEPSSLPCSVPQKTTWLPKIPGENSWTDVLEKRYPSFYLPDIGARSKSLLFQEILDALEYFYEDYGIKGDSGGSGRRSSRTSHKTIPERFQNQFLTWFQGAEAVDFDLTRIPRSSKVHELEKEASSPEKASTRSSLSAKRSAPAVKTGSVQKKIKLSESKKVASKSVKASEKIVKVSVPLKLDLELEESEEDEEEQEKVTEVTSKGNADPVKEDGNDSEENKDEDSIEIVDEKTVKSSIKASKSPVRVASPVKAATASPVKSTTTSPVKSVTASSVKAATTSPVKSTATSPVKSTATSPMKAATASPVKSTATSPVKAATASPVKAATASPVKAATASPVKAATASPVKAATASPVKAATASPVKAATASPAQSKSTLPVKKSTVEVPKSSVSPEKSKARKIDYDALNLEMAIFASSGGGNERESLMSLKDHPLSASASLSAAKKPKHVKKKRTLLLDNEDDDEEETDEHEDFAFQIAMKDSLNSRGGEGDTEEHMLRQVMEESLGDIEQLEKEFLREIEDL
jgi:hypothetical protein